MKTGRVLLSAYSVSLSVFVTLGAVAYSLASGNLFFFLFFLPLIGHFFLTIFKIKTGHNLLLYYSFILVTIMVMMGFVTASTIPQLISALLFCPLAFYFWSLVLPKRSQPLVIPHQTAPNSSETEILPEKTTGAEEASSDKFIKNLDQNRRLFLKLIGTAGLGVVIFSLFPKKAHLPFFDSAPFQGTVALKDADGTPINPAVRQPTDNYKISEVDDSSPSYFGFVEKPGRWFIMQIADNGAVRYSKGDNNFSTNWESRSSLTYGYYDTVF